MCDPSDCITSPFSDLTDEWLENNNVMFVAIKKGLVDTVKQILTDDKADVGFTISSKNAITYAAYYEQVEIMQLLLMDPRINPFVGDNLALKTIVHHQNVDMLKIFLSVSFMDMTVCYNYAYKMAVKYKNRAMIQVLVSDDRIRSQFEPADYDQLVRKAIKWSDNNNIVKILLADQKFNPEIYVVALVKWASAQNDIRPFELLLERGINVNIKCCNVLKDIRYQARYQASYHHVGHQIMLLLIKSGQFDASIDIATIGHFCYRDDEDFALGLIRNLNIDPSQNNNQLMHIVLSNHKWNIVLHLLKDPRVASTVDKYSIFKEACDCYLTNIVRELMLNHNFDVCAQSIQFIRTALLRQQDELVKLLASKVNLDELSGPERKQIAEITGINENTNTNANEPTKQELGKIAEFMKKSGSTSVTLEMINAMIYKDRDSSCQIMNK